LVQYVFYKQGVSALVQVTLIPITLGENLHKILVKLHKYK
jgi:hypothetical protein